MATWPKKTPCKNCKRFKAFLTKDGLCDSCWGKLGYK